MTRNVHDPRQADGRPGAVDPPTGPGGARGAAAIGALARRHRTLIGYAVIGTVAAALDVGVFMGLYALVGVSAVLAHSVSMPAATLFSFLLNARHNFRATDRAALRLASFVAVAVAGYGVGLGVIAACAAAGASGGAGKIASLPVVFAFQYALNSRVTFRRSPPAAS